MSGALREIFARFDVDTSGAEEKTKHLEAGLSHAVEGLKALAGGFLASELIAGVREFVQGQVEIGAQINDTAERLGVGVKELQRFQYAAQISGASADDASTALRFLNKNLGEAAKGGEAAKAFSEIGVKIRGAGGEIRSADEVVTDVADSFGKMKSQAEKTEKAMALFGRGGAALIPLLSHGSKEVRQLFNEFDQLGGGLSEDFVRAADQADDQLVRMHLAMAGLKSQIALHLIPGFIETTKRMTDWYAKIRKATEGTKAFEVAVLALKGATLFTFLVLVKKAAELMGILRPGAGLLSLLHQLGKFSLIAVGVIALAAVFEDLYTWISKGDSVVGRFLDKAYGKGASTQALDSLKGAWDGLVASITSIGPATDQSMTLTQRAIEGVAKVVGFLVIETTKLLNDLTAIVQVVGRFGSGVMDRIHSGKSFDFSGFGSDAKKIWEQHNAANYRAENPNQPLAFSGASESPNIPLPASVAGPSQFGQLPVSQQNQITIQGITVQGATTNPETANAVKNGVVDAMQSSLRSGLGAMFRGGKL